MAHGVQEEALRVESVHAGAGASYPEVQNGTGRWAEYASTIDSPQHYLVADRMRYAAVKSTRSKPGAEDAVVYWDKVEGDPEVEPETGIESEDADELVDHIEGGAVDDIGSQTHDKIGSEEARHDSHTHLDPHVDRTALSPPSFPD
jgi:hypothetical protein